LSRQAILDGFEKKTKSLRISRGKIERKILMGLGLVQGQGTKESPWPGKEKDSF